MRTELCPAQQRAHEGLRHGLKHGNIVVLYGADGAGKTTVLREIHDDAGGAFLTIKEFLDAMRSRHPLSMEETLGQMMMDAMAAHDLVIVDDLDLISNANGGCSSYPRAGFADAPLAVIAAYASEAGKKLVFGTAQGAPTPIQQRSYAWRIDEFQVEDYDCLCHTFLSAGMAGRLDYAKIYRFAPGLNAHQLKGACQWLKQDEGLDTERFIDYLRSQQMATDTPNR